MLIGEIQKIAKSNPAVAQWLSASLGALVNYGLGKSPITGATEAQYGTKWNSVGAVARLGVGTSRIAVKTTSGEIITEFSPYVGNPSAFDQVTTKPASFSDRVSDQSTPMDDVISPGPDLTESSDLTSPVVLKSEDYKLYNLPPDVDNQTGQISVWDNEKQEYVKTNTYEFGGIKVNDLGGYDEFNRAIFTEVGTGNLVYGINKYGVTLYRGSDGLPNWHLVIPENNFAKIGKLDGSGFERLNITTGDLDMLRDPGSTAIFDSVNSRIINSNTGNPLSNIGYKNFKNNISLDTISKNDLVNLQWDNDGVTVKVKGKDSTTDTIIFENMSSMGYKNSQTVLDGIRSGAITPGKPKFTREPKFDLGLSSVKLNDGPIEAFKNWKGITAQVGVDFPATEINMSAWSGNSVWRDTKMYFARINIDTFLRVNKKEASIGSKGRANVVELELKKSFDIDRIKVNLEGRIGYGAGAGVEGGIQYSDGKLGANSSLQRPKLGLNGSAGVDIEINGINTKLLEIDKNLNHDDKNKTKK